MKTIQFPGSEIVYEIVDNAAREALAGKQPTGDYATKTELTEGLAGKQPTGDYATVEQLNQGLDGKQPTGDYATTEELNAGLELKQPIGDYVTRQKLDEDLAKKQPVGDYVTNDELTSGLAEKQPIGDYATNTALTEGLSTKQPMGDYATNTALAEGLAQKQPTGNYALKSELPDVSAFITKSVNDLVNYYTKTEVDNKISTIPKFSIKVVDILPFDSISTTTIYLLKTPSGTNGDLYTEYIYVDGAWESLGTQTVDLSGYVTTEALNAAIAGFITEETFTAHTGNTNNPHGVTAAQVGAYVKPVDGIPETDLAQDVQDKLNGGGGGSLNIVDLGTFSESGGSFSATVSEENYAALSTPGTVVKATIDGGFAELYFVLSKSMIGEGVFAYISTTGASIDDQLTIFSIVINEDKRAVLTPVFVGGSLDVVDIGVLSSSDGGITFTGMITSENYERLSNPGAIVKVRLLAPEPDYDETDICFLTSSVIDSNDGSKTYYSITGGRDQFGEIVLITLNIDHNLYVSTVTNILKTSTVDPLLGTFVKSYTIHDNQTKTVAELLSEISHDGVVNIRFNSTGGVSATGSGISYVVSRQSGNSISTTEEELSSSTSSILADKGTLFQISEARYGSENGWAIKNVIGNGYVNSTPFINGVNTLLEYLYSTENATIQNAKIWGTFNVYRA